MWGVQADLHFRTTFVLPSASDPASVDLVNPTGCVGFRRLRDRAWPISVQRAGNTRTQYRDEELDPSVPRGQKAAHLVRQFCGPSDLSLEMRVQGY